MHSQTISGKLCRRTSNKYTLERVISDIILLFYFLKKYFAFNFLFSFVLNYVHKYAKKGFVSGGFL